MDDHAFSKRFQKTGGKPSPSLPLEQNSRVAVIGGGPAGSFFSYFLLDMAKRIDLTLQVDIYEPKDFDAVGPAGCNHCGGVVYESLVQSLAVEGIDLPTSVVQRGIEFNMLHLDVGSTQIQTPRQEKRIATLFRGGGPRGYSEGGITGFDDYLLEAAVANGARHIRSRITQARWSGDGSETDPQNRRIQLKTQEVDLPPYDLLVITAGVNTNILKQFGDLDFGYQPPQTTKLLVREYYLGEEVVSTHMGPVFHAFLLDIPKLDYAAIIPKGKFLTICLLSSHGDLDAEAMETFLNDPAVKKALPPGFSEVKHGCTCSPRINVMGCKQPYGDRIVFIGDSGVSRLYKDGIGAAYRAAKIAASTVLFHGVSKEDFRRHFLPFCRKLDLDNRIGKLLFRAISQIQKLRFSRRAVLRMVSREQQGKGSMERGLSMVMWDMLTGGARYQGVLQRVLHPAFLARFLWNLFICFLQGDKNLAEAETMTPFIPDEHDQAQKMESNKMDISALGKLYQDGETIVRQGETGDCMFVIQEGTVEIVIDSESGPVRLNTLGKNEFFGEMAIFENETRTATVRALGPTRILTVDHKNFLQRVHEDPSLAYRVMRAMSSRIRKLIEEKGK